MNRAVGEPAQDALTLTMVREIFATVAERRSAPHLHHLDGPGLFGPMDLPDGLHPDPAGYRRMGERFTPVLRAHLGERPGVAGRRRR